MKFFIPFLLCLFLSLPKASFALELSPKAQISLITGSPAQELYALFGHSAIRVYDPFYGMDIMYNYGTFNFNTPNFVLKFAQGRLLYTLTKNDYESFVYHYKQEGRSIEEQILNLDKTDKQKLFDFLENNAKPQNASYKYDFFYDNCATRIRDVLDKVLGKRLVWQTDNSDKKTFKQLITPYLKEAWVNFGIYLILGMRADYYASPAQKMFLPDHLADAAGQASLTTEGKTTPLAQPKKVVLQVMVSQPQNSIFTPLVLMSVIALGLGGLTYWEHTKGIRLRRVDFVLFLLTGLSGCLFLTMWIATDHLATHINLNMLWAFPPHAVLAFWLLKRQVGKFLRTYLQVFAIFQLLLIVDWYVLPQQYHIASLPIILLLAVRAWMISKQKG